MRIRRLLTSTIVAVALVPLATGPAEAAPPDNDDASGALTVTLGARVTQDTTEATTDAGDDALNESCGAPFTNASVWYEYTADVDRKVAFDASESGYSAGLMVFKGTPSADSLRTCGPGTVGLKVRAGKTYYVMVFSDTETNGGSMVLRVRNAPSPKMHVTVARHGVAFHGGAARVHGTYRCKNADFAFIDAVIRQRAGRLKIRGEGDVDARCNGKTHRWSARVVSPVGTYARGKAKVKVTLFGCGLIDCRHDQASHDLRLAWGKGKGGGSTASPSERVARPQPAAWSGRHWPTR
jgi:hypothetical protein